MMEIGNIAKRIYKQKVKTKEARDHAEEYLELLNSLKKCGAEDDAFQRKFSYFYRLRRKRSFKKEYFKLISKGEHNLLKILKKLYDVGGKVEFSFATKAINAKDKTAPIWDQNVKKALGKEFEMECVVATYGKLLKVQKRLLKDKRVKKKIGEIRNLLTPELNAISDEKILDFLMWDLGG